MKEKLHFMLFAEIKKTAQGGGWTWDRVYAMVGVWQLQSLSEA